MLAVDYGAFHNLVTTTQHPTAEEKQHGAGS